MAKKVPYRTTSSPKYHARMKENLEFNPSPPATEFDLSGFLFIDYDRNDSYQGNDALLEQPITVELYDSLDVLVSSIEVLDGVYQFQAIPAGTYRVSVQEQDTPEGYGLGTANDLVVEIINSNVSNVNFGYDSLLMSISGYLFIDSNGSDFYEPNESPMAPGIEVILLTSSGVLVEIVLADANGYYAFHGIEPGMYRVFSGFNAPEEWVLGTPNAILLEVGDSDHENINFGFDVLIPPYVTGTLYADSDGSDTFDNGEIPLGSGIQVNLLSVSNAIIQTTFTDVNGNFSFDELPAQAYLIEAPESVGDNLDLGTPNHLPVVVDDENISGLNFGYDSTIALQRQISGTVYMNKPAAIVPEILPFHYNDIVLGFEGTRVDNRTKIDGVRMIPFGQTEDNPGYTQEIYLNNVFATSIHRPSIDDLFSNGNGFSGVQDMRIEITDLATGSVYVRNYWSYWRIDEYLSTPKDLDANPSARYLPPGVTEADVPTHVQVSGLFLEPYNPNLNVTPAPNTLPDITVNIYASDGSTLLDTVASDANGQFTFLGLAINTDYVLEVDVNDSDLNGAALAPGSANPLAVSIIEDDVVNSDFCFVDSAAQFYAVSGSVRLSNTDLNEYNATFDDPLESVTVQLVQDSSVIYSGQTDANGAYSIQAIPGDYTVHVLQSSSGMPPSSLVHSGNDLAITVVDSAITDQDFLIKKAGFYFKTNGFLRNGTDPLLQYGESISLDIKEYIHQHPTLTLYDCYLDPDTEAINWKSYPDMASAIAKAGGTVLPANKQHEFLVVDRDLAGLVIAAAPTIQDTASNPMTAAEETIIGTVTSVNSGVPHWSDLAKDYHIFNFIDTSPENAFILEGFDPQRPDDEGYLREVHSLDGHSSIICQASLTNGLFKYSGYCGDVGTSARSGFAKPVHETEQLSYSEFVCAKFRTEGYGPDGIVPFLQYFSYPSQGWGSGYITEHYQENVNNIYQWFYFKIGVRIRKAEFFLIERNVTITRIGNTANGDVVSDYRIYLQGDDISLALPYFNFTETPRALGYERGPIRLNNYGSGVGLTSDGPLFYFEEFDVVSYTISKQGVGVSASQAGKDAFFNYLANHINTLS